MDVRCPTCYIRWHDKQAAPESPARIAEVTAVRAIKLSATIGGDRTVVLKLPGDVPEGSAEVIVLVPDEPATDVEGLLRVAAEWREKHPRRRTKEEIDRYLAEERASWNDDR